MQVPQVVIVGRPNVGKSSLFNWLARKRLAIVDDFAGVTRDRMTFLLNHRDRYFEVVDTGGIGIDDVDDLTEQIETQIAMGIESADLILFVVDTQSGILTLDRMVADRLRKFDKPILCVANKADSGDWDVDVDQFYQLGHGPPVNVSTTAGRHREELLDRIVEQLPEPAAAPELPDAPAMKIAIVGRRNVGKSTFVNTLADNERMIVSEVPGTTRDSVDVHFEIDGETFIAIDTPGLRKAKSVRTDIDYYGAHRAQRSIRRSDVTLLFFDAEEEIGKVDKQLCDYIMENYKPCIFVVNKWDLVKSRAATEEWADYLHATLPNMAHVPIAFITAQTGKNVKTTLNHAKMLFKQSRMRVSTGRLNSLIKQALERHPPALNSHHRRPKIYYATQASTQPPTIVLICNDPKSFTADYRRYLLNVIRDHIPFSEVPVRLLLRRREREEARDNTPHVDHNFQSKRAE